LERWVGKKKLGFRRIKARLGFWVGKLEEVANGVFWCEGGGGAGYMGTFTFQVG